MCKFVRQYNILNVYRCLKNKIKSLKKVKYEPAIYTIKVMPQKYKN